MKRVLLFLLLCAGVWFAFWGIRKSRAAAATDKAILIVKGVVHPMDTAQFGPGAFKYVMVGKSGNIISVTNDDREFDKYYEPGKTDTVDCINCGVYPGFIDAHAHVALGTLMTGLADLSGSPYGHVNSIKVLQDSLRNYIASNYKGKPSDMIVGYNYDDAQLDSHQQPTRYDLDKIDNTHPIYILHVSAHMGVANSKFLEMLNVASLDTVSGGTVVKENGVATGLLLENTNIKALGVATDLIQKQAGLTDAQKGEMALNNLKNQEKLWFSYGITTICEGRADRKMLDLVQSASEAKLLKGDYIVMLDYDSISNWKSYKKYYNNYHGNFKIGGVKFTFDGSPQGKDAYLTKPYKTPMIGQPAGYVGSPIYSYDDALKYVGEVVDYGMPVHIHMNGDSAIGMGIKIFNTLKAQGRLGKSPTKNVFIHCQLSRKDQLEAMNKLNQYVMESFFPIHVYVWGDWYRTNVLDTTRANYIAPLKDAQNNNLFFTIHTDAPVTPPDLLTAIYAASARKTQSGVLLGPDQAITPVDGIKAITTNAAYQWGELGTKGMLKVGYKGDIVVLSRDVFHGNPDKIKNDKVLYTFKNGERVYDYRKKL